MALLYVQLGKLGDILNILPLLYLDSQAGQRNTVMVAKKYADLFDGISYCDCLPFNGEVWELDKAMKLAELTQMEIKCCQVNGPPDAVAKHTYREQKNAVTDCFQKEAWKVIGRLGDWPKLPPLVFDIRNRQREAELVKLYTKPKKKLLLVSTGGESSPFPYGELLNELLRLKFPDRVIVNLNEVKAHRFYDLLGLYEAAHCLVAVDSAPLHLSYACPGLPTIALAADRPLLWHGAAWRPHFAHYIRYRDFPVKAVEMLARIFCPDVHPPSNLRPSIFHVFSQYETTRHTILAYPNLDWNYAPIELGACGRDSRNSKVRDEKRYPFLKDAIRLACLRARDTDVICLTRPDTLIKFPIDLSGANPKFAYRLQDGNYHHNADLFAFTKEWWQKHESELPDLIMAGDYYWSRILLEVVKRSGGVELPAAVSRIAPPPTMPSVTTSVAMPKRAEHNKKLHDDWLEKNQVTFTVKRISEQLPCLPMEQRGLRPFGYNPSIIRWQDRLLMAYRYHFDNSYQTILNIAELSEDGTVMTDSKIEIPGQSIEDPRLFIHDGDLWISFIDSIWPARPPVCQQKYARLLEKPWRTGAIQTPDYGRNDGNGLEKNWWPMSHGGKLYFGYQSHGQQIILETHESKIVKEHVAPGLLWAWGPIKGGTTPMPYHSGLLRFFHSTLDNEIPPFYRRYFIGAAFHSSDPPFKVIAISKTPLLRGSEDDNLTPMQRSACWHRKEKVVFPAGVIEQKDGWLLAVGVNDAECALVQIAEKALNL